MEIVATIITSHGNGLSASLLNKLTERATKSGMSSVRNDWLAEGEAADIFGSNITIENLRDELKKVLDDETVDLIVQPAAHRRKKFLAADMESTIIEQEMLDELAAEIGRGKEVAEITRRTMNGELDFVQSISERTKLFAGKDIALLEKVAQRITFMPGAEALVATMRAHGAKAWLVTGGFSFFADPVARKLGFEQVKCNELILRDGKITGALREPVQDRHAKHDNLQLACNELKLSMSDCVAVGDGANDVPMLDACNAGGGLGIAFRAKPHVRQQVPHHVNHADLKALLYAQGYRKKDFLNSCKY